jgi:hypothetical protein
MTKLHPVPRKAHTGDKTIKADRGPYLYQSGEGPFCRKGSVEVGRRHTKASGNAGKIPFLM